MGFFKSDKHKSVVYFIKLLLCQKLCLILRVQKIAR